MKDAVVTRHAHHRQIFRSVVRAVLVLVVDVDCLYRQFTTAKFAAKVSPY